MKTKLKNQLWCFDHKLSLLNEKNTYKGFESNSKTYFEILRKSYFKKWKISNLKTWNLGSLRNLDYVNLIFRFFLLAKIENLAFKSSEQNCQDSPNFQNFWVFELGVIVGREWMSVFAVAIVDNLVDNPILLKNPNKLFLTYITLHNRGRSIWN